jgi:ketosteroid isomerase-like protein
VPESIVNQSPESDIRALIERRMEAIRNKDAAAAIECLSEAVVAFEMVPPLALPMGAARDEHGFTAWLSSFEDIEVELHDLAIHADSHLAFAHSLNRLAGTRVGGAAVDLWMRSTLGLRREAEGWRIVHAHTSVPFYPGPEPKAALDLQP